MPFYGLALGVLSVFRVAHLFYAEDGPWDMLVRLRQWAGSGFLASLLDCFYCLSLWIAAPLALWIGEGWKERLLLWPALSGGAILLERVTSRHPTAPYFEEENNNGMLWRKEKSVPPNASGSSGA